MSVVIDASAVLAILKGETGADAAVAHSRGALLSTVNLVEVGSKLFDVVHDVDAALAMLQRLEINIVPFTPEQARIAADLWPVVKGKDISIADRACLATAMDHCAKLITADQDWAALGLDIELLMIR